VHGARERDRWDFETAEARGYADRVRLDADEFLAQQRQQDRRRPRGATDNRYTPNNFMNRYLPLDNCSIIIEQNATRARAKFARAFVAFLRTL
jgi:hypothetical protein